MCVCVGSTRGTKASDFRDTKIPIISQYNLSCCHSPEVSYFWNYADGKRSFLPGQKEYTHAHVYMFLSSPASLVRILKMTFSSPSLYCLSVSIQS